MSFEDQLGALAAKLQHARNDTDAALQSVREGVHNRVDGIEAKVAADLANVLSRLQEAEDGIVRHRDQLMQALRAEALDKMHELEDRIKTLEGKV